jgi:periplasmic protein TonB
VVIYSVEPEFSEEARKAKVAGNVLVGLWIDTEGRPSHVHVVRGIGMGLDQKAVEAVQQWKFKPAMENGKPVLVELNIEVNFQIF